MWGHRHDTCRRRIWRIMIYLLILTLFSIVWYNMRGSECDTRLVYKQPGTGKPQRTDVPLLSPWLAPIVWNGTYNLTILNAQIHKRNIRVGITIFAIKKYTIFLQTFIETAEKYFMVGHKVTYYVFTDRVRDIPILGMAEGRQLLVLRVPTYQRWQDVSMRRMEMLRDYFRQRLVDELDYLVCVDVDMRFTDEVGVEILSDRFGTIHPGMYESIREDYTYERNSQSEAYIPLDEGDYYYAGGFFGGNIAEVFELANFCHKAMMTDRARHIEATWHDESYLNKYFLYHKPTKILSPEYLWDDIFGTPHFLKRKRFLAVKKNHDKIRN